MNEPLILSRGKPYPLPFPSNLHEGAAAQFLRPSANILQILLPNMSSKEEKAVRSGLIKAGLLYEAGTMLWLFQFYGDNGRPLLSFDAPFDVRILPADERNLHSIENAEQRLLIEIHLVDERKILRGIRVVTMPPALTLKFLASVQDQLVESRSGEGVMRKWQNSEPIELIQATETWVLGN
jgi:hypothetical protein